MARDEREIEKEIRRIEGQLLVAKQICRENLKEINHLKSQQENDFILRETNRLLSIQSLNSTEHTEQFNKLLETIYEQQTDNEQNDQLLRNLSSNITELESLFDYAKNLFTQPISSVNMLNNTISLQNIADNLADVTYKVDESNDLTDLQTRIGNMRKRLSNIHQCDDCFIQ